MIKEVLLRQKLEVENIINKKFIERENIEKIKSILDKKIIKVITGPRRSGKSSLGINLIKDKKYAYANFDDEILINTQNYGDIIKNLHEIYGNFDLILFDEIQNLSKWEIFVNRLQREGYNLIITGSNAKLLSKELSTYLTGRYIEIKNYPFSFREFLKIKNYKINKEELEVREYRGKLLNLLIEYIKIGGFPEVIIDNLPAENYIKTLFDNIIFNDIVRRFRVKYPSKIYELAKYLISNISTLQTFRKIKDSLMFKSVHTVENYIEYLKEAYIIFSLDNFSFKLKEQIRSKKKIYSIDLSFPNYVGFKFIENIGRLIENLVAIELLRKEKEIYYFSGQNFEIDFLIKDSIINKLVQVTYSSNKDEIDKREIRSLIKGYELLKEYHPELTIITWDYEDQINIDNKIIKFIPLYKFLLNI